MNRRSFLGSTLGVAAVSLVPTASRAQNPPSGIMTAVTTRGYTNARDCANLHESILNAANVKQRGLRQYFELPMEGDARGCEAQPLIVPNVLMSDDIRHDVLIACSMNNTVWCYDANDSADLWMKKLGYPINGSTHIDMHTINDHWGILSTPVVDPETNKLYLVAWVAPDGVPENGVHRIVTMDITTGDVLKNVNLTNLTYEPGHGLPPQEWKKTMRKQRSSLLMTNVSGVKTVFFASGSVLETNKGASGWIIAYDPASQSVSATLALTSRFYGGGIWMGGQGLSADSAGFIYGVTGNGSFDAVTDFSECVFKVKYTPPSAGQTGKLEVVDWWSPYSDAGRVGKDPSLPTPQEMTPAAKLSGVSQPSAEAAPLPVNAMPDMGMEHMQPAAPRSVIQPHANISGAYADQDLGSGGACLIEKYGAVLFAGKDGIAYVINMANMGKTKPPDLVHPQGNYGKLKSPPIFYTYYPGANVNPAPDKASDLNFLFGGVTHHMHSTSVVYDSPNHGMLVFCAGENGNVRAWSMSPAGKLSYLACSSEYASWVRPGMPGCMMALSANGSSAGSAVLWALCPQEDANTKVCKGNLLAYDATNFATYSDGSGALTLLWKSPDFTYNKFMPPVISGGRVFVATYDDRVLCFGLA